MHIATIRPKHQLTIPRAIRDKLHLAEGDQVIMREEAGRIVIEPAKVVPAGQEYFSTPQWQAKEAEAEADVEAGRVSGPFADAELLLAHLHGKTK